MRNMTSTSTRAANSAPNRHGGEEPLQAGSPQQEAIWQAVACGTAHVAVDAWAGTGKTYTLTGCLRRTRDRKCGFLAFNKHIARELRTKVPSGVIALTLHSLGFAALRKAFPKLGEPDEKKLGNLARRIAEKTESAVRESAIDLARLVKYTLADPKDARQLLELADRHGIDLCGKPEAVLDLAARLVEESRKETGVIDFDDMIDLPLALGLNVGPFDLLLLDEAQDTNKAQQALALRAAGSGRLVIAGDQFQSIYGFTGADCEAIPSLTAQLSGSPHGCRRYPLTVTRRCPQSHVRLAQALVPDIEALPEAREGVLEQVDREQVADLADEGDMVICRTNAPLLQVAYAIISRGGKATVRGRNIGDGLTRLVERLKPDTIADLAAKLAEYRETERKALEAADASQSAILALTDKCECLKVLVARCQSVDDVLRRVDTTFADTDEDGQPREGVICSSVHRAKGLESDRVFVVAPWLLPHAKASRPWEIQQERNIAYVAATRAKHALYFAGNIPEVYGDGMAARTERRLPVPAESLPCPTCRRQPDEKRRCWKCCDRACSRCGRQTGSAFIELCFQCSRRMSL
jgi:superfamily I DNA/RNA helicase